MIKKLIVIIITGAIIYSAYLYAEPHYTYYMFKSDVEEYIRVAIDRKKLVMEELLRIAKTYNIPIDEEDIHLKRKRGNIYEVKITWKKKVDWFTLYQRTFSFTVDTTKW